MTSIHESGLVFLVFFVFANVEASSIFLSRQQRAIENRNAFKSQGSMDDELKVAEVIPNTHTSHLNISFEEFYQKYNKAKLNAQTEVQHVEKLQIAAPSSSKNANPERYAKMVDLLIRITPHLETVTLTGSHMYKPNNENRPDLIKDEVLYVRSFLKQILGAFSKRNVRVENVRYLVGIVVAERIRKQVDFGRLIHEAFGYQPTQDEMDNKAVGMVLNIDSVPAYIGVGVNPSQKNDEWTTPTSIIPTGRSDFVHQAILTNFRKEWYTKVLDMIQTEPSTSMARHRVNDLSHKFFFGASADDAQIRAVGRTNEMPRRLFENSAEMDFLEFGKAPQLQLEDFFDKHVDNIRAAPELERLGLRVMVQNRSGVALNRMYETAVDNLRKIVPNLKEVNLFGGYVYQPQKPTRETINRELEFVADNLRQWIFAFEHQNVTVKDVRYISHLVVPSKIRETSGYVQTLKRIFNYQPTSVELAHHAVRMRLEFDGVPCRLGIHFSDLARGDDQDFCLPMEHVERQSLFYYACPEKRASQQWYRSVWSNSTFGW